MTPNTPMTEAQRKERMAEFRTEAKAALNDTAKTLAHIRELLSNEIKTAELWAGKACDLHHDVNDGVDDDDVLEAAFDYTDADWWAKKMGETRDILEQVLEDLPYGLGRYPYGISEL